MAEISLRAYSQEIDRLIERNQLDEAIAHCRHLLQTYPKHLESYRLLGKSYLEAKRFGDAADIFQRVLSAVPDDFIAHIGMSIVREDEGNLDSAIWHMERGFETNPANPAIQQELRRLIGRRDGIEPQKVRLTRGALARMYAHGELYPQAIAELRAALEDDTDRPDLEVLLGKLYWRTDQKVEAVEVASRILERLPYCLEANRIMAAALQERERVEDAAKYHRRLAALDPYAAYVESAMADPATIDAGSIQIDRLSWQPGQPLPASEPGRPEWAASLGIELEEEEDEGLLAGPAPSWLDSGASEFDEELDLEAEADVVHPFAGAPTPDDPDIPAWMREAGWSEGDGEAVEEPVSFTDEELDSLEEGAPLEEADLQPAEIPDWLRESAPEESADIDADAAEDLPSWLDEIAVEPDEAMVEPEIEPEPPMETPLDLEVAAEAEDEDDSAELPAWLEESEPGATETITAWLGDRPEEEEGLAEEPPVEAELPDWLQRPAELEDLPADIGEAGEEDLSWVSELAEEEAEEEVEAEEISDFELPAEPESFAEAFEAEPEPPRGDAPDWLQDIADRPLTSPLQEKEPSEDTPDWLAGLDEELEPLASEPEESVAEAPDWLAGIGEGEEVPQELMEAPEADDTEAPDVLDAMEAEAPEELAEFTPELEGRPEEAPEDTLEWLRGLGEEADQPDPAVAEEAAKDVPVPAEIPDWLAGLGGPAEPETTTEQELEVPEVEEIGELAEPPADVELPEAAAEEELVGDPTSEEGEFEEEPDFEGALDWLREPAQDVTAEPEDTAPLTPVEEAPAAPSAELPGSGELDAASLEGMGEDEVFAWLEGLAARQGASEEELLTAPEERLEPEGLIGEEAPPEAPEEGLEWLERLADERGIDMEVGAEAEAASEVPEAETEMPEWLEHPVELEEEPSDQAEMAAEALPDWLTVEPEEPEVALEPPLEEAAPEPAEDIQASEEAPDWLHELADSEEAIDSLEDTLPPAFSPEEAEPPLEEATLEPSEEFQVAEEAPDWLHELAESDEAIAALDDTLPPVFTPEEAEAPPPAVGLEAEAPGDVLPDEPEVLPAEAQEPSGPAEDEPEWLRPAEEPAAAAPEAEIEVPEWLRPPAEAEPDVQAVAPEPESELSAPPEAEPEALEAALEEEAAPTPVEAEQPVSVPTPPDEMAPLAAARHALASGDRARASELYRELLRAGEDLEKVTADLELGVDQFPDARELWELLGDAYLKSDRTSDAVRAYGRGMNPDEILETARRELAEGNEDRAATFYGVLLKKKAGLNTVIEDIEFALEKEPDAPRLWQALGDAYMKADRVADAVKAYRRGMESV